MSFSTPKPPPRDPAVEAAQQAQAAEAAKKRAEEEAKTADFEKRRKAGRVGVRSLLTGSLVGYENANTTLGSVSRD